MTNQDVIDNISKDTAKRTRQAFDDGFRLGLNFKEIDGKIVPMGDKAECATVQENANIFLNNYLKKMTKKTLILLVVLTTTMTFAGALDLKTEPRELATLIEKECDSDLNCLETKEYILRDIFSDKTQDIDFRINILFTLLILLGR